MNQLKFEPIEDSENSDDLTLVNERTDFHFDKEKSFFFKYFYAC